MVIIRNLTMKEMLLLLLRGAYAGFTHYLQGKFWAGGLCYSYRSKNENELLTKFIFLLSQG